MSYGETLEYGKNSNGLEIMREKKEEDNLVLIGVGGNGRNLSRADMIESKQRERHV